LIFTVSGTAQFNNGTTLGFDTLQNTTTASFGPSAPGVSTDRTTVTLCENGLGNGGVQLQFDPTLYDLAREAGMGRHPKQYLMGEALGVGRGAEGVVTGRKGGVFMTFQITGRAAHSGVNFTGGISAIEELGRKVQAIHALTDLDRGVTVNVGLVRGGQSVNTVAPAAEGQLDIRYVHAEDRDTVVARVKAIVAQSFVPGTQAQTELRGEFLPLRPTPAGECLFALYAEAAQASGFAPEGEFTGGCADSGFAAGVGVPTLCAVGPVGGNAHTADEFLELDSLVPRAQACARAILGLERAGL